MIKKEKIYITTAISYANGEPHLGHAYEAISADVLARFYRLDGHEVHFITGMDEHGEKVQKKALDSGMEPQAFCDMMSAKFEDMCLKLGLSNDDFIKTTQERHKKAVRYFWSLLEERGDIYLGNYAGWYSVRDEAFFGEDELTKNAKGQKIAPSGSPVEWVEEPSYFFRLSNYGQKLLDFYEAHPDFIKPDYRRNEVIQFVRQGLMDLSISRTSFRWGIEVPNNPEHVVYVWLDALVSYISALGYPDEENSLFQKFWPANVHVIGKDILRFHAIFWPAFLMSAKLPLPERVFGHGFWMIEGQKMSKSLGNVVAPLALVDKFGLDPLRYFLMREIPFGNDGSFSNKTMMTRINSDLSNDYGNLVQRVLSMIYKNCDKKIPTPGAFETADDELLLLAKDTLTQVRSFMGTQNIYRALETIWFCISKANQYVDKQAPWALRKTDPARMRTVLYVLGDVIRIVTIYTQMIMPQATKTILDALRVDNDKRQFCDISIRLNDNIDIDAPCGVFPRVQLEEEE